MKRVLTTVLAVALLLGLGALAVLAMPNASAPLAAAPVVSAAAAAPEAVDAIENYNMIAMPLNAEAQFTDAGLTWDANGLAEYIGGAPDGGPVQQVLRFNATSQTYETWLPEFQDGENFSLAVGGAYWVLLDNTDPDLTVFSVVGDVPAQESITFNLAGDSASCKYNELSIPLDRPVTDADGLAEDINTTAGAAIVEQVLRFSATAQTFETWLPEFQDGENFLVSIGYPYVVCLKANVTWPW